MESADTKMNQNNSDESKEEEGKESNDPGSKRKIEAMPPAFAKQRKQLQEQRAQSEEQRAKSEEQLAQSEEQLAAIQKQRAQSEEQLAAIQKQRAKLEEQLAAEQKQRAKSEEQLAAIQKKSAGTYFALIDDAFVGQVKSFDPETDFTEEEYKKVCRNLEEKILERKFRNGVDKSGQRAYENIYVITEQATEEYKKANPDEKRTNQAGDPADGSKQTSNTSVTDTKKQNIWFKDVLGQPPASEIAHLVNASVEYANTYWFVTDFLFQHNESRTWTDRLRLIHGTNQLDNQRRVANTGVKHSVANRIVLPGQAAHFDKEPNILIIPILTVQEAKGWRGGGYEAIMLIDVAPPPLPIEGAQRDSALKESRKIYLQQVNSQSNFSNLELSQELAERQQVETAHELVKSYTKAILYAQLRLAPDKIKQNEIIENLENKKKIFDTKLADSLGKVVKIKFTDHTGEGGHPAPDPILLVTRAANQLQRRRWIELVAATEPEDDDYDNRDEKSILAEEYFLERRKFLREGEIMGLEIAF